jgi:hypothetical protein
MATTATQRFITGTSVFDTYSGCTGEIQEMNLSSAAVPSLAPLYTGTYFIVRLTRTINPLQAFTVQGKMIDHTSGAVLAGVTLVTSIEYTALLSAGYPK